MTFFSVYVCTEEAFNQTETVSSKSSPEVKNVTQSTTVGFMSTKTTAAHDTINVDINKIVQNNYNVSHKESKIVGGYQTHDGEIPYQVNIYSLYIIFIVI